MFICAFEVVRDFLYYKTNLDKYIFILKIPFSIFNPNRERLKNYRGYDISELQDKFRSITILKSRWGESDIEIGFNFFGNVNIWRELPLPDEIYNYEDYKYLDKSESINSKNSINFTI